jgi:hypothetical protein
VGHVLDAPAGVMPGVLYGDGTAPTGLPRPAAGGPAAVADLLIFAPSSRSRVTTSAKLSGSCQKSRWPSSGRSRARRRECGRRAAWRCAGPPRCRRHPAAPACVRGCASAAERRRTMRLRRPERTRRRGPPAGNAGVRRGGRRVRARARRAPTGHSPRGGAAQPLTESQPSQRSNHPGQLVSQRLRSPTLNRLPGGGVMPGSWPT